MAQVAMAQQLQLEERQRMGPLVEQEQHQQARTATDQPHNRVGGKPVQPRPLRDPQHHHAQAGQSQRQPHAVELREALQAERILRQAPCHRGHRQQ
jgi:hypothetical protein